MPKQHKITTEFREVDKGIVQTAIKPHLRNLEQNRYVHDVIGTKCKGKPKMHMLVCWMIEYIVHSKDLIEKKP